jgi:hypothetical protein
VSNYYAPTWDPGFERSLIRMGLNIQIFEALGGKKGVSFLLETDPFEAESTFELAGTGYRYLRTKFRFPDLPSMLIAYEVEPTIRAITVKGAEPVWEDDLVPPL